MWLIAGVLYAKQPDGVGRLVWEGIAIEKITHGLVEVALAVFCGHEEGIGALCTPGDGTDSLLSEQGGQIGGGGAEGVVKPAGEPVGEIADTGRGGVEVGVLG